MRWKDAGAALEEAARLLGGSVPDARVRQAAWIARCVGRGADAPLTVGDVAALAQTVQTFRLADGQVAFTAGRASDGVWIVRDGTLELAVGGGPRRAVVQILRPGDVDGDIALLLDMPFAYTARALRPATCLYLGRAEFDHLLAAHPAIARRWLTSVAARLADSQARIMGLLGRSLTAQITRLLLDEAVDGRVALPQRTLAAMLGVQRPSLNKILKGLEADGLIAVRYGTIELIDAAGLTRRAC